MLAKTPITDTYLTAAELGITEAEREALIWVREELASGRIKHETLNVAGDRYTPKTAFNMNRDECGSAVCICGWMRVRLGRYIPVGFSGENKTFAALFLPRSAYAFGIDWDDLTPAQAVRAIDFWATGHQADCWALALSDA